jgi:hypothetical protein
VFSIILQSAEVVYVTRHYWQLIKLQAYFGANSGSGLPCVLVGTSDLYVRRIQTLLIRWVDVPFGI